MVWEHFIDDVKGNKNLTAVAESCRLIKFDLHTRQDMVPLCNGECWMSCLHGIHQQNSNDLEWSLHALHNKHHPIMPLELMSCWGRSPDDKNVNPC